MFGMGVLKEPGQFNSLTFFISALRIIFILTVVVRVITLNFASSTTKVQFSCHVTAAHLAMLATQNHKIAELLFQQLFSRLPESKGHLILREREKERHRESHKLIIGGADPHCDLVIRGKLLKFISVIMV